MSQPYIGEIRMFGGNFAPQGWMFCTGQSLPIAEYDTLFNLIGTTYGGDGQNTFALPNLSGRVPLGRGSNVFGAYGIGQSGGTETVTLTANHLPLHFHAANASATIGHVASPSGAVLAAHRDGDKFANAQPDSLMAPGAVQPAGNPSPLPHENTPPYLCVSFIISLFGIFPSQA